MNSLGPNRRSWSTLTHTQEASTIKNSHRNHIGASSSAAPPASPAHKSKQYTSNSSLRKLHLRHIPLFLFSFISFIYIYMIHLPSTQHDRNGTTPKLKAPQHAIIPPPKVAATTVEAAAAPSKQDPELIHVIQTRFMQHQPNLLSLGQARLELFQTFCLPSLKSQVNKNFLWIIRTDPDLHPSLRDQLVKLLDGKDNYVLLGSNYNPEGFGRDGDLSLGEYLREDSHGKKETSATVLSGNITLIEEAFAKSSQGAIVLETRLDADDGLHRDFVKTVQSEARHLADEKEGLWRIWCINYNVEWHPLDPFPDGEVKNRTGDEGYLVMYSDPNICVTPGLTFGYGKGASRSNIGARLRHDEIVRKITPCTPDAENKGTKENAINTGCFSRLSKLSPGAIRSRTTTSAGMDNVVTGDESHDKMNKLSYIRKNKSLTEKFNKQYYAQDKLWSGMNIVFKISQEQAATARKFIVGNTQKIAEDNLKGQCTAGHSCKNGAQSVLKSIASS